jgi:hypothetical protein
MVEHTKTPWAVHRYDRPSGGVAISGPDTDETNAFVATAFADSRTMEEAEANAAFIVRACNSFDDLTLSLAWLHGLLENKPSDFAEQLPLALAASRAALIKASGGTP